MTSAPEPATGGTGFRPRRVATVVAIVVAVALAIDAAVADAGFVDGLVITLMVPLCVLATPRAVGLWRGKVAHTELAGVPSAITYMSPERARACTPCAIVAVDGLCVAFVVLILTGGEGAVAGAIMFAGGSVALLFVAIGLFVAVFLRPRELLPASMRRQRPT